jgi:peptidoglycan/LPS O-acetylase OafA/YrhL
MTDVGEHPPPASGPDRVVGLDGVRGLAALYVVVYHIFLRAWPGYPGANHAPFWAALLSHGRGAVAIFIALSGFSLGLGPARSGWRLKSIATYAHRRAWRILPPYWAALVFSLVMTWFVLGQPGFRMPNGKSVVVYGLLVQDIFSVITPNRAFWSIAIEVQLYFLLPLLLLLVRRVSAPAMVGLVTAIVVTIGLLGPHIALMNTALVKFIPDLAVLFAVGLLASGIVTAGERARSLPWAGYALAAAVPATVLMVVKGGVWSNINLFWLDLAWTPAIGCFLTAVATSHPPFVVRVLDSRMLRSLGSCSYSLYLTHAPIVIAVSFGLVWGHVTPGTPMFFVLVAILLPVTVGFARLFAAVFELPFLRHRGWIALREAMTARISRASGPRSPADVPGKPARPPPAADRAQPASRPGPPAPPGPGDRAARSGSC